ncbi:MAG: hypothetical protein EZS28_054277, partial [Streblomastix strix]
MADYMRINEIQIDELMNDRPDIHIVNAMAWVNDMGGKNRKSKIISLKTNTRTALSQFSKMAKISDSAPIRNFSRFILDNSVILAAEKETRRDIARSCFSSVVTNIVCRIQLNSLSMSQITSYLAFDSVLRFKHLEKLRIGAESLIFAILENQDRAVL